MTGRPGAFAGVYFPVALDGQWIDLPDGNALAKWGRDEETIFNHLTRHRERWRFYASAFDFLKSSNIRGDYFEFGCHGVHTFRMALTEARRRAFDAMRFCAFDSFEGLPATTSNPDERRWHQAGALKTTESQFWEHVKRHGIYTDRIVTIKGFYDVSLTPELAKNLTERGAKIALACIDCDLYESAQPVFDFVEPFLQEGSVIYIDDIFTGYRGSPLRGVARAFAEFQHKSRFKFIRHLDVGWIGRSYIAYLSDASGDALLKGAIL